MDTDVTLGVDPTVLYYVRVQGMLVLAFAAFVGLGCAIVPLFSRGPIDAGDVAWLVTATGTVVVFTYSGVRTLALRTPAITLTADDVLHVGGRSVRLDASTEISCRGGVDALTLPCREARGYGAMPSAIDFPPRFTGGPTITITTGDAAVSLQPLLYGPSAYVASSRPAASALMQRVVRHGTAGDARAWLASAFAPDEGATREPPRFRTFVILFVCIATPIFGLLAASVATGIARRLAGR